MCFVLSLLHISEFHWSNPGMDYLGIGKGKPATNFEAACERTGPGRVLGAFGRQDDSLGGKMM